MAFGRESGFSVVWGWDVTRSLRFCFTSKGRAVRVLYRVSLRRGWEDWLRLLRAG